MTTHVGITETLCLCLPWPSTACDMSAATGATFFGEDYELYRDLLSSRRRKHGVAVFSLLLDAEPRPPHPRPDRDEALGGELGETHRR